MFGFVILGILALVSFILQIVIGSNMYPDASFHEALLMVIPFVGYCFLARPQLLKTINKYSKEDT